MHHEWRIPLVAQPVKYIMAGVIVLSAAANFAVAQQQPSVAGLWQKTDEQTGNPVSWFLFTANQGVYEGYIAKLFLRPGDPPNQACSHCQDDRKDAPMLGLSLIRNMRPSGLEYQGGNILDPRDGNIYNAMMRVSPDGQTLTVRGYLGIALFGRDETWHRLPDTAYKQLDPVIVAQYLPNMATGSTSAMHHQGTSSAAKGLGYSVR
jgi:uncharacterized protein (DUF2147 family)